MLVAETYLGHREDPAVAERLADADPLRTVLSDTERRRSRVRTTTDDGRDLGVVVARDLADGDVLEAADGTLLIVELRGVEALVLDLGAANLPARTALELGHALGNRHWDLALRGEEALFPVVTSRERTEAVVEDVVPASIPHRYETVPPTTFDGETGHGSGGGHAHSHASHSHGSYSHDDHEDGDHAGGDHADVGRGHAHGHRVRSIREEDG